MQAGVDIGGTFTDLLLSVDGKLKIHKLLSTPRNPAEAMLVGLEAITAGQIDSLRRVAHGSTVATNAILERKGARTALITTKGFRDVLFIGRQNRPVLYALHPRLPPPLIPRELCYEVPERLDHTGAILTPLDMAALDSALDEIAAQNVDSVAVCLLFSYVNSAHEEAIQTRILERGLLEDWQIALSSAVLPEFREYERASTVALEAYVRPVMSRYITRLEAALPNHVPLNIMKSDGGVMNAQTVRERAVNTALSGPAAGVIGAFHLAKLAGFDHILTFDMGGTSTDVALCPGTLSHRPETKMDGLPLRIHLLDIETIGAGGGSIARLDMGGALRVGPESAGADPGPMVYGRGGTQITVSDANAILGRLDAGHFLGGHMTLNLDSAREKLAELAGDMNLPIESAAKGVIDVANVNIDRALRRVSIARGHDPRQFTLVAFGGAGPLHACEVADRLEIPRVLIPRYPGVLCALGLLIADIALDYSRSVLGRVTDSTQAQLANLLEDMIQGAKTDLRREGIPDEAMMFHAVVDMRYAGQAFELEIPFQDDLIAAFHRAHETTYGHALPGRTVEAVNLRLQAIGVSDKPQLKPEAIESSEDAYLGEKTAASGEVMRLYDREKLTEGELIAGSALIFQLDSTIYIPPSWSARIDRYYNLVLQRNAD
jgi:N-methylhydantoinase A